MEGDTIRASSSGNMLIDLWIDGAMRELVITSEAIAAAAGAERAAAMSDNDRCEFIRTRLSLIQTAARNALGEGGRDQVRIHLKAACLVDPGLTNGGERRRDERRNGDRRRMTVASSELPHGERRKRDRRRRDRRGTLLSASPTPA